MAPLISVIMPTYNRAHLLPRAIQSVLDQAPDEMQFVIVDDGSQDDTPAVVAAVQDSRIDYVRLDRNRGIGYARHTAISHVRGDLVAFIDSDDLWLPGKLALQLRLMQAYPQLEIIFGDFMNINHLTGDEELGLYQNRAGLDVLEKTALEPGVWEVVAGFPRAILTRNFISPPTVMLRANSIKRVGNFNQALSGPEDLEFWWRAALHGVRFGYTETPLTERHKDAASVTSNPVRQKSELLRAYEFCAQAARDAGQADLIAVLNLARQRAYNDLIRAYALEGQRLKALAALRQSVRYGVTRRTWQVALLALAGPRVYHWQRSLRSGQNA